MKAIRELMNLVTKYKRKEVKVLGYNPDATDRFETFYNLFAEGKFQSDDEAARHFFGDDKDGSFTEYRNLRNSFFKRLVTTSFFIDMKRSEFNDAEQAHHSCYRNLAAVHTLWLKGARHAAVEIASKTVVQAIKYELTDVVLDLSRLLRQYYSYLEPDKAKAAYYEKLVHDSLGALNALTKAETMYNSIVSNYALSRSSKPWLSDEIKTYLQELEPLVKQYADHKLHLYYHILARYERDCVHDYAGTIERCRASIRCFEGRHATPKSSIGAFYNTLIISLTLLGRYEEAEEALRKSEKLAEPGSHNWYKRLEQQFALQLHKQDYHAAYLVFKKAKTHPFSGHLGTADKEMWTIFEGYIQLLIEAGKIKQTDGERKKNNFKPGKFLNEMPEFSKDKRGMNIPMLIIHTVFLLYLQRYEEACDRILALEKYADRNLKEEEDAFRSWCFIKALQQIHRSDFKREGSEQHAAELLRRMSTQPVMLADAPYEVEYMPYEHVWGMAMEALVRGGRG